MLKKRIIGSIIVKDGWAVQSFGYKKYLPLGRPKTLAKNLDRWGADEIIVLCIDRSKKNSGPDFGLLEDICSLNLTTPIAYGGGLRDTLDGRRAIEIGCERLILEAAFLDDPEVISNLAKEVGKQALIASVPLLMEGSRTYQFDYRTGRQSVFDQSSIDLLIRMGFSEIMVIDVNGEGYSEGFNQELVGQFEKLGIKIIAFGGVYGASTIQKVLDRDCVSAVAIGNFLNYSESTISKIKGSISLANLRNHDFRFSRDFKF